MTDPQSANGSARAGNFLRWVLFLPAGFIFMFSAQAVIDFIASFLGSFWWISIPAEGLVGAAAFVFIALPCRIPPRPVFGAAILAVLFVVSECFDSQWTAANFDWQEVGARLYMDAALIGGLWFAVKDEARRFGLAQRLRAIG